MAIVVFNEEKFRAEFPAFADEVKYPDEKLNLYFDLACEFVNNTENSRFPYDPDRKIFTREVLLRFVMCHLLTLDENNAGAPVGRIASASQGSVSTSFDLLKTNSYLGDWWNQTQCGAKYWILSMKYRIGPRISVGNHYHPWG